MNIIPYYLNRKGRHAIREFNFNIKIYLTFMVLINYILFEMNFRGLGGNDIYKVIYFFIGFQFFAIIFIQIYTKKRYLRIKSHDNNQNIKEVSISETFEKNIDDASEKNIDDVSEK